MTQRDRVLTAIQHKQPSRVPLDLGSISVTTMNRAMLASLQRYLGDDDATQDDAIIMQKRFQNVDVPEELLLRFDIDLRGIRPGKPKNFEEIVLEDGGFVDEWGIAYTPTGGGAYYDIVKSPLLEVEYSEIDNYLNLDTGDPGYTDGIKARAEQLYHQTGFALVGNMTSAQIFERCWYLRGFEKFLMDLHQNKQYAHKLLRLVTDIQKERVKHFLAEVGDFIQIFKVSDDLCGQLRPLISPALYREMIQPYHREYFEYIKGSTDAKLALHCCGNFRPFLGDFIDSGVDIIHTVQQSCPEMDPAGLKRDFGDEIVFWGAIDIQNFLPRATPMQVKNRVMQIIDTFSPGGGYIFGPSHNFQADIPPENIVAMYDTAMAYV